MEKSVASKPVPLRLSIIAAATVLLSVLFFSYSVFASSTGSLLPTSDGNYAQWTPSSGTSHFAMVDDTPCNGTTDYNSTTGVGNRDSYGTNLSSVPNGATIAQIDIKPCASRNANGGGTNPVMNVFYRTNGIDSADSGSYSLTGTTPAELATTSFSGLSITKGSTSTLEIGAVLTSGTKGARLSRIVTTLTYTPLTAPTNLSGTATTSSAIALSWTDTSSNETGFNVERSTDALNWTSVATTSANVVSYHDLGLSASTTYYHRVRAFNSGAYTSYSNTSTTTTLDNPPSPPSGLSATASATNPTIALAWNDNSSNETNFEVLRSLDGSTFTHLATTSANTTSYNDAGLASSTTYYYEVQAYNSAGYSTTTSNVASDTTGSIPTSASNLMLTSSSTALKIDLSWTDNSSNELNFRLEQSTTSSTSGFNLVSILPANTTSTSYTPLFANTLYYFRILTGNGYGTTTSDVASTTSASLPPAPSGLSLSTQPGMGTTTDIILNWTDNSSNELGFKIERSTGGAFNQIATTSADAITYTDPSHTSGTYSYRLRAYNGVGNSAYSNTASTTIP